MGRGLVFCGGGAKGAFQIGVWQAFTERGISKEFKSVSGTSVGALNALLFALGDVSLATHIWGSITSDMLLSPSHDDEKGLFSRTGLTEIIDSLPLNKLNTSCVESYATMQPISGDKCVSFRLNGLCKEELITVLLASSALPVAYGEIRYKGEEYTDGGITEYGNVPIEPLYSKCGCRDLTIVSLDSQFNPFHINKKFNPFFHPNATTISVANVYPEAEFVVYQPAKSLGGLFSGTMNFSPHKIRMMMNLGYAAGIVQK